MDWTAPDPLRADYAVSLWLAATERGIVPASFVPPAPNQPLEPSRLRALRGAILDGCTDFFVTNDPTQSVELFTVPKFSKALASAFFTGLDDNAPPAAVSAWMAAAKGALSKLRWREGSATRSESGYAWLSDNAPADYPLRIGGEAYRVTDRGTIYAELQANMPHVPLAAYTGFRDGYGVQIFENAFYSNSYGMELEAGFGILEFTVDPDRFTRAGADLYLRLFADVPDGYGTTGIFDSFDMIPVSAPGWFTVSDPVDGVFTLDFTTSPVFPTLPAAPEVGTTVRRVIGFEIDNRQSLLVDLYPILNFK